MTLDSVITAPLAVVEVGLAGVGVMVGGELAGVRNGTGSESGSGSGSWVDAPSIDIGSAEADAALSTASTSAAPNHHLDGQELVPDLVLIADIALLPDCRLDIDPLQTKRFQDKTVAVL